MTLNAFPDGEPLRVSLVIPIKNESGSIAELIESIIRQSRPPNEIVLVDGGSTDGTVELARELTAGDARFRVIEAGEATPGRGRNVGIAAAHGEWIALTDAGIRLEPTWLMRLLEVVESDPGVDIVYGNYEPWTESFFQRCAALAYVPPMQVRGIAKIRGESVASMLLKWKVWDIVGGFPDLRAAEDLVFMERTKACGFQIDWAANATVHWQLRSTLVGTFRRFQLYSKHNVWAGRQRYWHYGIARMYLCAAPFFLLALLHGWYWLSVPLAGMAARTAKSIWRRREDRGLLWLMNPAQFITVGGVLAAIDAATFLGWLQAWWQPAEDMPRQTSSPSLSPHETASHTLKPMN